MEKRNLYIALGVGAFAIILVGAIAFFMLRGSTTTTQQTTKPTTLQQGAVPTLTPQDLGLTISPSRGGKALTVSVSKLSDVSLIDYELDYNAQSNGNTVPRGVIGKIEVKSGQATAQQEIVLGTCSDVCHYDTGVSDIQLTLKVTKVDGTVYSLTTTASL